MHETHGRCEHEPHRPRRVRGTRQEVPREAHQSDLPGARRQRGGAGRRGQGARRRCGQGCGRQGHCDEPALDEALADGRGAASDDPAGHDPARGGARGCEEQLRLRLQAGGGAPGRLLTLRRRQQRRDIPGRAAPPVQRPVPGDDDHGGGLRGPPGADAPLHRGARQQEPRAQLLGVLAAAPQVAGLPGRGALRDGAAGHRADGLRAARGGRVPGALRGRGGEP
mmetsp:Transcript_82658/g.215722  ORF Transcript_82658/g.215722 Transcript_82658/m.215722 type:complete len:224 (+) Transcript_82658:945-1616(+)